MATTRIIFGAKNKVTIDFIEEKLMEFLLFNEVLKNLISFLITYQKSWLYNTNVKQIKVLNANL